MEIFPNHKMELSLYEKKFVALEDYNLSVEDFCNINFYAVRKMFRKVSGEDKFQLSKFKKLMAKAAKCNFFMQKYSKEISFLVCNENKMKLFGILVSLGFDLDLISKDIFAFFVRRVCVQAHYPIEKLFRKMIKHCPKITEERYIDVFFNASECLNTYFRYELIKKYESVLCELGFSKYILRKYTRGWCSSLSYSLNYYYGYEIYELYFGKDFSYDCSHSFVKVSEDKYLDVIGFWSEKELIEFWEERCEEKGAFISNRRCPNHIVKTKEILSDVEAKKLATKLHGIVLRS